MTGESVSLNFKTEIKENIAKNNPGLLYSILSWGVGKKGEKWEKNSFLSLLLQFFPSRGNQSSPFRIVNQRKMLSGDHSPMIEQTRKWTKQVVCSCHRLSWPLARNDSIQKMTKMKRNMVDKNNTV